MKSLEIKETQHTPYINLDAIKGKLSILGKSFPEDCKQFYQPILDWLDEYRKLKPESVELNCNLFYLSSSSMISVKQVLAKLVDIQDDGAKVTITWNYDDDDDDIRKTGEDYMKLTGLKFLFKINAE